MNQPFSPSCFISACFAYFAVARAPAFLVAAYAMLLWSSIRVFGDRRTEAFARLPAWRRTEPARPSTRDLIRLLQQQAAQVDLTPIRN